MDITSLVETATKSESMTRETVPGRVLQADSDFFCYYCAHADEPLADNIQALKNMLEVKRAMAGAQYINVHTTVGLKGGREQMATVKPYQEDRNKHRDPELKKRVQELRSFLATYENAHTVPKPSLFQEADDAISIAQLEKIRATGVESSVIMSGDKDLWMVDGLHCDGESGNMWEVSGYGHTEYREVGNVKPKLVGEGTSWFWHQMIMGDTADTIPGLPKLAGHLAERYLPGKKPNPKRADVASGPAKAVAVLTGVSDDKTACGRVFEAYKAYYGAEAGERFVEQAFLLWMRRTQRLDDVLNYLQECGLDLRFSDDQIRRLARYNELCKIQIKQLKENT